MCKWWVGCCVYGVANRACGRAVCARGAGVDVRRHARDSSVLARRARVPQDHAVLVPRRHRSRRQPQQRSPRRSLAR